MRRFSRSLFVLPRRDDLDQSTPYRKMEEVAVLAGQPGDDLFGP